MPRLDPPSNVSATDGLPTSVVVTWDAVDGVASYAVFRSLMQGYDGAVIGITDTLEWTDSNVTVGLIYWYSVQSRGTGGSNGCSLLSAQNSGFISSTPTPTTPERPTGLIAVVL